MPSNSDSKFKHFLEGFFTPFHALELIFKNKKILGLSLIPFLLSVLVIFSFASVSSHLIPAQWSAMQWGWINFGAIAQVFLTLFVLFIGFQFIAILLNLVASPFNDFLSEQTEKTIAGSVPQSRTLKETLQFLLNDIKRSLVILVLMLFCTIGTWIPAIGLIFILGIAMLNAATFVAYSLNRRGGGTLETFSWIKKNWPQSLGFGIAATLLFGIPLVNLFALPLCVVGGTQLFLSSQTIR